MHWPFVNLVRVSPLSRAVRIENQILDLGDTAKVLPLRAPIQTMGPGEPHCAGLVKDISHFPDGKQSHKKVV